MKKTLALGMAAAMTATLLAGCGGSSSSAASSAAASTAESTASSTAAASTAESTGSYTDYSAGFPENVTIQIPVYDRGFENWNPTDNYYTRWIQSEFGEVFDLTFWKDESLQALKHRAEAAQVTITFTSKIGHAAESAIKATSTEYLRCVGGMTSLRDMLTRMYVENDQTTH